MNSISKDNTNHFQLEGLRETGRIQFFYHSPSSELPVRDVLSEQKKGHKTEPHIEIGAENYISPCYQSNNIIPFLKSDNKYLFLATNCKWKNHKHFGKKVIVGFIIKKGFAKTEAGHYAVIGDTFIYSFDDGLTFDELNYSKNVRLKKVNLNDSKRILNHFKGKINKLEDCILEIKRLDKKNKDSKKTCKILKGKICNFQKSCLRWKIN